MLKLNASVLYLLADIVSSVTTTKTKKAKAV